MTLRSLDASDPIYSSALANKLISRIPFYEALLGCFMYFLAFRALLSDLCLIPTVLLFTTKFSTVLDS